MNFDTFSAAVHKSKPRPNGPFVGRLLALDPGETTGWSLWDAFTTSTGKKYILIRCGQLPSWDKVAHKINPCVTDFQLLLQDSFPLKEYTDLNLAHIVMESYRVYDWKLETHSWSDVPTLRIIGSIETRLIDAGIPYTFQTAQVAKQFVTDDRLKEWGFYQQGARHSRDSMRHALYFLLFGIPSSQQNQ